MKLIDLLNMIARGEDTPDKIMYKGHLYTHNGMSGNGNYYCDELNEIIEERIDLNDLATDEVEDVEEKKIPEKLYKYMEEEEEGCFENILKVYDGAEYEINEDMSFVIDKINEIIDYLNKEEKENE